MSSIKSLMIFALGAAVGSAATWYYMKNRECVISEEEIVSDSNDEEEIEEEEPEEPEESKPDTVEYTTKRRMAYRDYSALTQSNESPKKQEEKAVKKETPKRPYVISPTDAGTLDGFELIELTYYQKDGVLADELDDEVVDVDDAVGLDSLNHFGEYDEEDSVFVRNEERRIDYQILLDYGSWSDVRKEITHRMEEE